ncbi:GPW/gp25 family protein [Sorangium sp. So ce291]|uniref:GPW/gp25 family protein n=1 Tax=Sorangium sp. So ce291 TaxID=3133294 RepID=UPI003F632777
MAAPGEQERAAFEERLAREARRFDLRPLLEVLRDNGYDREDILFEGARDGSSTSPSIIEAVRFLEPPARGAVITLNLGLFSDGTLLPSYFLEAIESSPDPDRFFDFIRFFEHRLSEGYVRAVYPEEAGGPFGDMDRALRAYFRMLGPGSVSTLQWLWQLYFPELRVRVTRRAFASETASHAFRTGESRLDGTGIIGRVYPWEAAGFIVDILVEDEVDDLGRPWPGLVRARMSGRLLPLLDPFRIPLLVRLVVLHHASWARVEAPGGEAQGYLGYERLRDKAASPHTMVVYRGVTGERATRGGGEGGMFLYKHFMGGPSTSEVDDVVRNLRFVLGTKRGAGYFLRSFGLTDVGYRTQEEMVVTLIAEIEENVRLYEPRVELVGIDEAYGDEGGRARLEVKLRLRGTEERLSLVVDLATRTFDFQAAAKGAPGEGEAP